MRKIIKKLSIILIFAMVISGICPSNVSAVSKKYVKSLTVSKKSLSISVGKSKSLSYKVNVKGKASKKITVKASNANVKATVSNGKIKLLGKKQGSSKITISTKGKNLRGKKIIKTIIVRIIKEDMTTPFSSPSEVIPEPINPLVIDVEKIFALQELAYTEGDSVLTLEYVLEFLDLNENDCLISFEDADEYHEDIIKYKALLFGYSGYMVCENYNMGNGYGVIYFQWYPEKNSNCQNIEDALVNQGRFSYAYNSGELDFVYQSQSGNICLIKNAIGELESVAFAKYAE